jgi:hypothetical protein
MYLLNVISKTYNDDLIALQITHFQTVKYKPVFPHILYNQYTNLLTRFLT